MQQNEEPVMITSSMLTRPVNRRVDFERGMRHMPVLTTTLILGLIGIYAWQIYTALSNNDASKILEGALVRERVMAGEYWRVITAAFLHGGPDHLIGNLISLYILGLACEHALGLRGMAVVYMVSAIGGSLVSMAMSPGPSIGASGAIFGLMGAIVLILHRERERIFVRDKRIGVVIAVWAGYTLLLGAFQPMVDNGAHLGGLIAGALAAMIVPVRLKR
jgi:rhomboid protease GluP